MEQLNLCEFQTSFCLLHTFLVIDILDLDPLRGGWKEGREERRQITFIEYLFYGKRCTKFCPTL